MMILKMKIMMMNELMIYLIAAEIAQINTNTTMNLNNTDMIDLFLNVYLYI